MCTRYTFRTRFLHMKRVLSPHGGAFLRIGVRVGPYRIIFAVEYMMYVIRRLAVLFMFARLILSVLYSILHRLRPFEMRLYHHAIILYTCTLDDDCGNRIDVPLLYFLRPYPPMIFPSFQDLHFRRREADRIDTGLLHTATNPDGILLLSRMWRTRRGGGWWPRCSLGGETGTRCLAPRECHGVPEARPGA